MTAASGTYYLKSDRVFDGQTLHQDRVVRIEAGLCEGILAAQDVPAGALVHRVSGTLSPGFIDLQVNGGGGVLINATPTADGMAAVAAAHRQFGTTAILPTVITDAASVLDAAVAAALDAKGRPGIAGLHIEGPHISHAKHGTHAKEYIRPLGDDTLAHVRRLRDHGIAVMITLAPENATLDQIAALNAMGAVVSLGHSNADAATAKAAFAAGAKCTTHLFNAMSPMQNREPGLTGAAILSYGYAGIICDGVHVDDDMVALAFRAKPVRDRMFLVSDAMPTVGGPSAFDLYGKTIHVQGNRLVNAEGSLAGAHTTMATGVARLVDVVGLDLEQALRAAIHVPSQLMGLDLDRIIGRPVTDLICLSDTLDVTAFPTLDPKPAAAPLG